MIIVPNDVTVPIPWLVSGLWLLTMTLAGALGNALNKKLAEMVVSLEAISRSVHDLDKRSVKVETELIDYGRRIIRLEEFHDDADCRYQGDPWTWKLTVHPVVP